MKIKDKKSSMRFADSASILDANVRNKMGDSDVYYSHTEDKRGQAFLKCVLMITASSLLGWYLFAVDGNIFLVYILGLVAGGNIVVQGKSMGGK